MRSLKWVVVLSILMFVLCCGMTSAGASGSCGDNMTWVLDDDGVLTISGEGWMYSYPWEKAKVTEVIIEDGVENICDRAFEDCIYLTGITIPDSVTKIGWYAFSNCTSLTSITLPDSVTSIGNSAFSNCDNLSSIMIPDNVTSIGMSAFNSHNYILYAHLDTDGAKSLSRNYYSFRLPDTNYDLIYLFIYQ